MSVNGKWGMTRHDPRLVVGNGTYKKFEAVQDSIRG